MTSSVTNKRGCCVKTYPSFITREWKTVIRIILQKFLPTTYLTIYRFGVLRSSGYKSVKENGFPNGKGRKKLFYTERAVASAFTRRRSAVRVDFI